MIIYINIAKPELEYRLQICIDSISSWRCMSKSGMNKLCLYQMAGTLEQMPIKTTEYL